MGYLGSGQWQDPKYDTGDRNLEWSQVERMSLELRRSRHREAMVWDRPHRC